EFIVRRELAFNFCYFNKNYNDFNKILHDWVYKTLEDHEADIRKYIYNLKDLENWKTHDDYWNDVQKELVTKGTMNSYMRMYWGKKILEWSENAETAFNTAIYLNNRYFLDGRDPNSFTGVAWCFGKHDRPWGEREIFGKVRYMNETGIIRKSKLKML
ncbi:MAG: deoxyribodipyrimidine photo-lyase, partial [Fusobacteriaceae bacterium]